jgi:tetratricopeptide (TPR) repeat protein
MRNFERQADCYVYTLFDDSRALISTLGKIAAVSGQSKDRPNWHHFSIGQRMAYLEKCEGDPGWIKRHDRKVRNSIVAFCAALLILGAAGYQFSFGVMGTRTDIEYLNRLIESHPDNPYLYANLGSHYYRLEEFDAAARAWEASLSLKADNALVLNNLAWLYATCESATACLPERALQLARAAVDLDDSHFVLDTLAESFYANGMYAEAIQTEERALQKAAGAEERNMYRKQIEKFRKALEAAQ